MAITTAAKVDHGDTANGSTYVSPSWTPVADRLYLAAIISTRTAANGGGSEPNALTGNGLTWVNIGTILMDTSAASPLRVTLFRAMGATATSGTLTATFLLSQTGCGILVAEFDGVVTTGLNGADAVAQASVTATSGATNVGSLSVDLAALADSDNVAWAAFGVPSSSTTLSAGTNGNLLNAGASYSSPSASFASVRMDPNFASIICNSSTSLKFIGIGVEVVAAAAGGTQYDETGRTFTVTSTIDVPTEVYTPAGVIDETGRDLTITSTTSVDQEILSGAVATLVARLMQGAVEIASWTHENVGTAYTTIEQTLSGAQADTITDYSDLRLVFEATATGGGGGGGPGPAITATNLVASGSSTDTTSYTTATIAPGNSKLLLLTVVSTRTSANGGGEVPSSVTGLGLTWTQVATAIAPSGAAHPHRVTLYRAVSDAAQGSGTIAIGFTNAQTFCGWTVTQFDNVDTAAAGQGVVQGVAAGSAGSDPSLSITLLDFASADNATFGFFHVNSTSQTLTAGTGFSMIANGGYSVGGQPSSQGRGEFRDDPDTTVDMSSSGSIYWAGVAVELARA